VSHEFIITDTPPDNADDPYAQIAHMESGRYGKFHGYGDAALYKAFGALEFDGGVSGNFGGLVISKRDAVDGLSKAIDLLSSYPDRSRADSIKCFLEDIVIPAPDTETFYIHFY
jgi:hypothetical protein